MFGAILGDIVGSRFEFDRGGKTKKFKFITDKCGYTDDTVMTVAIADALLKAGEDADEKTIKDAVTNSMKHWGRKYPNAGYGSNFCYWLQSYNPSPYGSWGNGSAMRVSPVGWLYETLERTVEVARWTAEVTHNHPEGIKGAECTAAVIYLGRVGFTKEEIRDYVAQNYDYDLSETLDEMRNRHKHVESCMDSLPKALRSYFDGESYEDVVRNAVSLGGDTDTIAAIAGSMAEGLYGMEGMYFNTVAYLIGNEMMDVVIKFRNVVDLNNKVSPEIKEVLKYEKDNDDDKMFDWAYRHDKHGYTDEIYEKVVEIYNHFIEMGEGMAMNNLGSMYYNGVYYDKDNKMAEKYYIMACDKGIEIAFSNLACVYYYGEEPIRDYKKCYDILMKGIAFFNDSECYMRLGDLYRYGHGVDESGDMAFKMYVKALNSLPENNGEGPHPSFGHIRKRLGECFLEGVGVEINPHEALFNFCIALPCLYGQIDNDQYVMKAIYKLKDEMKKAEDILEGKIYQKELN